MNTPDLLVARPYRARYRDVLPGDNAGQIVRADSGWRSLDAFDRLAELMSEPPCGKEHTHHAEMIP